MRSGFDIRYDSANTEAHGVLKPSGRAVVSAMHAAMFLKGSQARFTDPTTIQVTTFLRRGILGLRRI